MTIQPATGSARLPASTGAQPARIREQQSRNVDRIARGLGFFSVGLGLAQLAAPERVARAAGVTHGAESKLLMRALGMRELTAGVGVLTSARPAGALWARVAGDAVDLALLGSVFRSANARRDRTALAAAAVAGVTLLDVFCAQQFTGETGAARYALEVHCAITIQRTPEELYRFWRELPNLPRVLSHLESVQVLDARRSHWCSKGLPGFRVEWDAEILADVPNERIAWRSIEGTGLFHEGTVQFAPAPGGRGTEIHLSLRYRPPGAAVGAALAKLFGRAPEQQISQDLRTFKQIMETGEAVQSDASIHSLPHPAQPPARASRTQEGRMIR